MQTVFPALAAIALIGASLHWILPDLDIDSARRHCGLLVLNVMLPALNIEVICNAPLGNDIWQVPAAMLAGAVVCVAVSALVYSALAVDRKLRNSLILASAFGNVTYLGMPLLRGLFPSQLLEVTAIAILCEITVTSSDLITGTVLAAYSDQTGRHISAKAVLTQLMKFPLLWSVIIAAIIRSLGVPLPPFLKMALHLLGEAASGLMLLVLGMALKPAAIAAAPRKFGSWWPTMLIKLGLSPLVVAFGGAAIGLSGLNLRSATMEAAMPPQLFIFIVADRFGFDTEVLAAAVAFLTVVSFVTLPILNSVLR